MMLKRLAVLLFLAVGVSAQGTHYQNYLQDQRGNAIANATVLVCTAAATGTPCSSTVTVYSDLALTSVKTTVTTNSAGFYDFYVACSTGKVKLQFSGSNFTTYDESNVVLACDATSFGNMTINETAPYLGLNENDQVVDERLWRIRLGSKTLRFSTVNDAASSFADFLTVPRGTGTSFLGNMIIGHSTMNAVQLETHLLFPIAENTDIGAVGGQRPRDVHILRNTLMGGTLGVTGATTLSGGGTLTGTFGGTPTLTGPITLTNGLTVGGATVLSNTLSVADAATFSLNATVNGTLTAAGANGINATVYKTATNCASSASPAACGSAAAGHVAIPDGGTTVVVNTTAVTPNSQIFLTPTEETAVGTRLGIICNAFVTVNVTVHPSARSAGTSFTIQANTDPSGTNPVCVSYSIVN